jgi:hypothetical protein
VLRNVEDRFQTRSRRLARSLLLPVLLSVLWGCTGAEPEIVQTRHRLRYVDDRALNRQYEQLELFVLAGDADGFEDLAELYVAHEESELSWQLDSSEWSTVSVGEERWLGSTGFTGPRRTALPRGSYRVIVEDLAGERAETTLTVSAPRFDSSSHRGPTLEVKGQEIRLRSPFETNRLELRDARGSLVRALTVEPGTVTAAELAGVEPSEPGGEDGNQEGSLPRLVDIYLFARGGNGVVYVSGPYRL